MSAQTPSTQASGKCLWTVEEVATFLRLKPETVRIMARKGELPAFKLGKRVWRFEAGKIQAWLSEKMNV